MEDLLILKNWILLIILVAIVYSGCYVLTSLIFNPIIKYLKSKAEYGGNYEEKEE